jgi:hypothetical protein
MSTDLPVDGVIDGAVLWPALDPVVRNQIVRVIRGTGKLCLISKKPGGHFVLEFLRPHSAPQWALPTWTSDRAQILCGSEAEAVGLAGDFILP